MKQINKIIISASVFLIFFMLNGCTVDNAKNNKNQVKNQENKIEIGEIKVDKDAKCQQEYEDILAKNKADLSECNFSTREDDFENKKIIKKKNNTVLIFDVSGSMAGSVDGKKKIDIAKEALYNFVEKIKEEDNINLSIVVYGHKGSNSESDKEESCSGIEEIYYMGKVSNVNIIKNKIRDLKPTGWTPIASSFKKAQEILTPYKGEENNNSILLISDGKETCGGDPIEEIKKLKNSDLHVYTNVIGFDVSGDDQNQLMDIARNGAGEYFTAKNQVDFENALEKHKELIREFDYKMSNISMRLEDIGRFGEKYFDCIMKLKEEESKIILDLYAYNEDDEEEDRIVSKECASYIENKYYKERYNKAEFNLNMKFDDVMADWKRANVLDKQNNNK